MNGDEMDQSAARWVEETVDPVTGEQLVFEATSEAELDAQLADWFGNHAGEPSSGAEAAGSSTTADKPAEWPT